MYLHYYDSDGAMRALELKDGVEFLRSNVSRVLYFPDDDVFVEWRQLRTDGDAYQLTLGDLWTRYGVPTWTHIVVKANPRAWVSIDLTTPSSSRSSRMSSAA